MIFAENMTLTNVCRGQAVELFARELEGVMENISDTRTPAATERQITVTVTIKPDEQRRELKVAVSASSRIAKKGGSSAMAFISKDGDGKLRLTNNDPKQFELAEGFTNIEQAREAQGGKN